MGFNLNIPQLFPKHVKNEEIYFVLYLAKYFNFALGFNVQ